MAKLSDIFLSLLGDTLMGAGGTDVTKYHQDQREELRRQNQFNAEMAMKRDEAARNKITGLTSFAKEFDTQDVPEGFQGPLPEGGFRYDLSSMGRGPVIATPRTEYDQVPEYAPNPKTGKMEFTGRYTQLPRPKGGRTTAYRPTGLNAERPRQTQYTTEGGVPLLLGSEGSMFPATLPPGSKAVPFKGDESAIGDAALIAQQLPNVDKLFDAYKGKSEVKARAQSTFAGGLLDPSVKQIEDSMKLAAFTFGGKQLTGQEKEVVFGALFPNWKDNDQSREQKRMLLKDYFAGKIDLLQAANLLGSAGGQMRAMLQAKQGGNNANAPATAPTLGKRVRVRNKKTGQTGTISEVNYDPSKYDLING